MLKTNCFIIIFFAAAVSCDKSEGLKIGTELNTGPWLIQSIEVAPPLPIIGANYFDSFEACVKDDQLVMNADNTYVRKDGVTKCKPTDPDTYETGKWEIRDNGKKILFVSSKNVTDEFEIITLSKNEFSINYISKGYKIEYAYKTIYRH